MCLTDTVVSFALNDVIESRCDDNTRSLSEILLHPEEHVGQEHLLWLFWMLIDLCQSFRSIKTRLICNTFQNVTACQPLT